MQQRQEAFMKNFAPQATHGSSEASIRAVRDRAPVALLDLVKRQTDD